MHSDIGYRGLVLEAMVSSDQDIEFSIVSGSNEEMLFGCMQSLVASMEGSAYSWSLTVTCNATSTGLAGRVRSRYPHALVIDNPESRGFAANHNRVLESSGARYVWLLNDDLLILPDAVRMVTEFMDRPGNEKVAVTSPRLLNPDGSLQPSTYGFPSMPQIFLAHSGLRELPFTQAAMERLAPRMRSRPGSSRFWAHDQTVTVDTLRGACVAVRRSSARAVGLMVEVAIVGGEETEWHRRFQNHGWRVVYYPEASVIHYGSQTVRDGSRNMYPEYLKGALYFFRSDRRGPVYSIFCASLLVMFAARRAFSLVRRDHSAADVARRYCVVAWDGLTAGSTAD
ncbi:MAG: glycosyltransferase family 2 protein [Gemmatimonadaceae bacterium]